MHTIRLPRKCNLNEKSLLASFQTLLDSKYKLKEQKEMIGHELVRSGQNQHPGPETEMGKS